MLRAEEEAEMARFERIAEGKVAAIEEIVRSGADPFAVFDGVDAILNARGWTYAHALQRWRDVYRANQAEAPTP